MRALALAYNGVSVGGIIFAPLWVAAIGALGFSIAAASIGLLMVAVMWVLADRVLFRPPQALHVEPDGGAPHAVRASVASIAARPLPGGLLWRDPRFLTLAAAAALVQAAAIAAFLAGRRRRGAVDQGSL